MSSTVRLGNKFFAINFTALQQCGFAALFKDGPQLVLQDRPGVEQFLRQTDGRWLRSETPAAGGVIKLTSIDCELSVKDIYDKIEF